MAILPGGVIAHFPSLFRKGMRPMAKTQNKQNTAVKVQQNAHCINKEFEFEREVSHSD